VQSLIVVKDLDLFEEFAFCVFQVFEFDVVSPLGLQRTKERFGNRVIPAVALSAHALHKMVRSDLLSEAIAAVLDAPVGMDQQTRWGTATIHGA
jgi:hypothetical protein